MKKFVCSLFLALTLNGYAQQVNLNIDSIVIYSLPMSMRTVIGLDDQAVRAFDSKIGNRELLSIQSIRAKADLDEFALVDFANDSLITDFDYSMDVRVVIDVYVEHDLIISLSMDCHGFYRVQNETYQRSRNSELNNWLRYFVHDLK